uniref:GOLGA2L5 domain-containing protein n=1 Tax=Echinostoma caproni TaxID=27848 RepID=A0A183A4J2_9TREM
LRQEQHAQKERDQAEVDYRAQLEQLQIKYVQLEAEYRTLQITRDSHGHSDHLEHSTSVDPGVELNTGQATDQSLCDTHTEQLEALMQELQANHVS